MGEIFLLEILRSCPKGLQNTLLRFIKVSLIKFIQEFIVVVGDVVSYICWEYHWGNGIGMPLYCNCTCNSSSTLIDSDIFASLASSSKIKWKYNTQLSNSLKWKPTFCWNTQNSSGKDLFLGRIRIVWCTGKKDVYLKVFEDERLLQDSSTTVHSSHRRKYFSSKYNSHWIAWFLATRSLLFTKRMHCLFNSAFFKGKWNFVLDFFSLLT